MLNQSSTMLILLYILGLLVPLIPAIIIYKVFPKDKISFRGKISNFTINSTGSAAIYFSTILLGFYFINELPELVVAIGKTPCKLKAELVFQDVEGNQISPPSAEMVDQIRIVINPSFQVVTQKDLRITLPELDSKGKLEVGLEGFKTAMTFIGEKKVDAKKSEVDIGQIVLRQEPVYSTNDTIHAIN